MDETAAQTSKGKEEPFGAISRVVADHEDRKQFRESVQASQSDVQSLMEMFKKYPGVNEETQKSLERLCSSLDSGKTDSSGKEVATMAKGTEGGLGV